MHLPDGGLSAGHAAAWWVVYCGVLLNGIKVLRQKVKETPVINIFLGILGVVLFVISSIHIPIPFAGSSAHMVGAGLVVLLVGPRLFSILVLVALSLQMAVLSHGGLSTMGANSFATWLGGLAAWGIYKRLTGIGKRDDKLALCLAGFTGSILTYIVISLVIAVDSIPAGEFLSPLFMAAAAYAPTQIPLAVAEGFLTAAVVNFIKRRRPALFEILSSVTAVAVDNKRSVN